MTQSIPLQLWVRLLLLLLLLFLLLLLHCIVLRQPRRRRIREVQLFVRRNPLQLPPTVGRGRRWRVAINDTTGSAQLGDFFVGGDAGAQPGAQSLPPPGTAPRGEGHRVTHAAGSRLGGGGGLLMKARNWRQHHRWRLSAPLRQAH